MKELKPASGTHVYNPIPWTAECVMPPYPNFYLDGHRMPPCSKGFTGYEFLPLDYTGPMVEEEYWNRMIGLWKLENETRREHAKMIADMMGVPLEFGEFGEMPYYKRVPEPYRVRRFQLDKLKILTKERDEEVEANRRRAAAEQAAIEQSLRDAEHATRHITAVALSHLDDGTQKSADDHDGAATVVADGSPRHLEDVDERGEDLPALETHAAQQAALQASDGAAAGSVETSASVAAIAALHRRAIKKIPAKTSTAPMEAVLEEPPQPSEAGSYHSADQVEKQEEQSELPRDGRRVHLSLPLPASFSSSTLWHPTECTCIFALAQVNALLAPPLNDEYFDAYCL
eukprot:3958193-Amphidinium_carterae.1